MGIFPAAMTRSASSSSLAAAALLGVASGMRSLLPLAVLSVTQGSPRGLQALLLPLAATELVRDKPDWTDSLVIRGMKSLPVRFTLQ